ncbi:hypothetical protein D3C71_1965300 [compost metagenome]
MKNFCAPYVILVQILRRHSAGRRMLAEIMHCHLARHMLSKHHAGWRLIAQFDPRGVHAFPSQRFQNNFAERVVAQSAKPANGRPEPGQADCDIAFRSAKTLLQA